MIIIYKLRKFNIACVKFKMASDTDAALGASLALVRYRLSVITCRITMNFLNRFNCELLFWKEKDVLYYVVL